MRPDIPQDEQGIYDFYRYNYMENYRQRKGQGRIILPTLVAVAILGLIILLLVVDLSWLITAILFTTMIATVTFVFLLFKWQKSEFELMDFLPVAEYLLIIVALISLVVLLLLSVLKMGVGGRS